MHKIQPYWKSIWIYMYDYFHCSELNWSSTTVCFKRDADGSIGYGSSWWLCHLYIPYCTFSLQASNINNIIPDVNFIPISFENWQQCSNMGFRSVLQYLSCGGRWQHIASNGQAVALLQNFPDLLVETHGHSVDGSKWPQDPNCTHRGEADILQVKGVL